LLNNRIEALLLDASNRMWIGNDLGLACFNIADTTLRIFDERYGLSVYGFRINSYYQSPDDELIWGTERGIQYFYPDDLIRQTISIKPMIHRIECRDVSSYLTHSDTFRLSPGNQYIAFHFGAVDYSTHLLSFYQYQLEGLEEEWNTVSGERIARYNQLPPGDYVFKVRASNDKKTWTEAENHIAIHLAARFFERSWFKGLSLIALGAIGLWVYHRGRRKQKQLTEAIETESVINYFASQINRHKHVHEMLWDIARNCISKLQFEECIIYLLDPGRQVLVQKAAYGPKNPKEQILLTPIEIPVGQGITGTVALTRKAEIVNNTEKDPRYIVDDERRLSEIAVPIVVDDEVLGVIDSEHTQRHFFTPKHLHLMSTIAVLTANQIKRIQAEEEKQKAEIEILKNKQKATESRLQSLRLQMNPHFLFNALNSIQQMILANEELVATRYLSRFSKLLRSILVHSDKEMISLREELEILRLYVELESVRFKDSFSYVIDCDEDLDPDEIKIPTLLVQPFVENAIWHGLMHKDGDRKLRVAFSEKENYIECVVEDNGIGRQKARELRFSAGKDNQHTSKGIQVSMERLQSLQKNGGPPGHLIIHDLTDPAGQPLGTRVEIQFPVQN
jgi:putative methionine-R-sulfoxide reductase with GAF domain